MKKLWKKGLPALLLLVFGAALAGCDNGTTSNTGNSPYDTKLAAEKLAYQLNDIMRSATRAQSGIDQVTLSAPGTIWGTPNKNDNINIAIPKGVTLKLDSINYLTLAATESGGAVTFTFSGEGTLSVSAADSLIIDNAQGDVTIIIGTGLTVKYGDEGAISLGSDAGDDITGSELLWQKGATFEVAGTDPVLIPGILPSDGVINLAVSAASGVTFPTNTVRSYGTLTVKKGGTFAAAAGGKDLQLGDVFVEGDGIFSPAAAAIGLKVGKITHNSTGTSAPAAPLDGGDVVINRGKFNPGAAMTLGNITVNANGELNPTVSFECGNVVVNTNGKLAPGAAVDFVLPKNLTVANGAIVDLTTVAAKILSVGGVLVNNGFINVVGATLKAADITNGAKGKITASTGGVSVIGQSIGAAKFVNEGTVELTDASTATGGITVVGGTLTNKGTIKVDSTVAATLSFTSSTFILEPNSKLDGVLVEGAGTMPDDPTAKPELTVNLTSGSLEFTEDLGALEGYISSIPVTATDADADAAGSVIAKKRWTATAESPAAVFTADADSFLFTFS